MKFITAFIISFSLFVSGAMQASSEIITLNSVGIARDVDGNPYVTVFAGPSHCEYPHYCNDKGTLFALRSHGEKIEAKILEAMDDHKLINLSGTKGSWVGQDDGWQIYDLWVDKIR